MIKQWHCPKCGLMDATNNVEPHTQYHNCPRLAGLSVPMLEAGIRGDLIVIEREDYTHGDDVTLDDNGKAVMAVRTDRDDGEDLVVYAPCATGTGEARSR